MSLTRKILLVLFFIGFAGNVGGSGTFASFNASTSNAASSFASGSIVLSNQKNTGTVCYSNGTSLASPGGAGVATDTNANTACEQLFNLTTQKPGDSATVNLTLQNVGSLAGTLKLYAPGTCATGTTGTYSGTGNLCNYLQMTIQRWTDSNRNVAYSTNTPPPYGCVFGNATTNTCSFPASTVGTFASTHTSSAPISLGDVASNATVYLTITLTFPNSSTPGADNLYMGTTAGWAFTWLLEQQAAA